MSETTGDPTSTTTTTSYAGLTAAGYLGHLRADNARILDLITDEKGLDVDVPACVGWTVRDAVEHTGSVFSHKVASMSATERPTDSAEWSHGPAEGQSLVEWFKERSDEIVATLEAKGSDTPCWSWHEDHQHTGFWHRRMAQEAAVHRVDVEAGYGVVSPIDHPLALDGVDEVLDWFLALQAEDVGPDGPGRGTVLVRTGDHVWRVILTADDVELVRAPGPADALVTGEASELLLWLWGRRPDSAVVIEGDTDLVVALRARLATVTE